MLFSSLEDREKSEWAFSEAFLYHWREYMFNLCDNAVKNFLLNFQVSKFKFQHAADMDSKAFEYVPFLFCAKILHCITTCQGLLTLPSP